MFRLTFTIHNRNCMEQRIFICDQYEIYVSEHGQKFYKIYFRDFMQATIACIVYGEPEVIYLPPEGEVEYEPARMG